jgi:hypothetical protein
MKVKVCVIDLEIPPRLKKWGLRIGIPLALLVAGGTVAYASGPGWVIWSQGQVLNAADLNTNFNDLQTQITALQPFVVEYTGGGSIPPLTSSTWVAVNFPTKVIDDTTNAVSTSSSWTLTVPVSGDYRVMARVCLAAATTSPLAIEFFKNNSITSGIVTSQRTGFGLEDTLEISDVLPLVAGDTLGVAANALNGATLGCGGDRFRVVVEGPIAVR